MGARLLQHRELGVQAVDRFREVAAFSGPKADAFWPQGVQLLLGAGLEGVWGDGRDQGFLEGGWIAVGVAWMVELLVGGEDVARGGGACGRGGIGGRGELVAWGQGGSPRGGEGVVGCRLGTGVRTDDGIRMVVVWGVLIRLLAGGHGEHPLPPRLVPRGVLVAVVTAAVVVGLVEVVFSLRGSMEGLDGLDVMVMMVVLHRLRYLLELLVG